MLNDENIYHSQFSDQQEDISTIVIQNKLDVDVYTPAK